MHARPRVTAYPRSRATFWEPEAGREKGSGGWWRKEGAVLSTAPLRGKGTNGRDAEEGAALATARNVGTGREKEAPREEARME